MNIKNRTTLQFYEELQLVYDRFNERLFKNNYQIVWLRFHDSTKIPVIGLRRDSLRQKMIRRIRTNWPLTLIKLRQCNHCLTFLNAMQYEMCHMKQSIFGWAHLNAHITMLSLRHLCWDRFDYDWWRHKEGRTIGERWPNRCTWWLVYSSVQWACRWRAYHQMVWQVRTQNDFQSWNDSRASAVVGVHSDCFSKAISYCLTWQWNQFQLWNHLKKRSQLPNRQKHRYPHWICHPNKWWRRGTDSTTMNPFDVAIGLIDISNTAANLGGYYPTAFDEGPARWWRPTNTRT